MRNNTKKIIYIIMIVFTFAEIFPIIWMIMTSFKPRIEILSYPPTFIFQPTLFSYVGETTSPLSLYNPFPRYILNSLIISVLNILFAMGITLPSAYAIARFSLKGKGPISFIAFLMRMIPPVVVAIPWFTMYRWLGLYDTHLGVAIALLIWSVPVMLWLMISFFAQIPNDIEDAAKVDGCSDFQVFYKISLPMVRTGIFASLILGFIFSWNDLVIQLMLTADKAHTVTVALYSYVGDVTIQWGAICAGGTIAILPGILFITFVKKYLLTGLTLGAVGREY